MIFSDEVNVAPLQGKIFVCHDLVVVVVLGQGKARLTSSGYTRNAAMHCTCTIGLFGLVAFIFIIIGLFALICQHC